MAKLKSYNVWADIKVISSIEIKAESLEDALAISKKLEVTDFIDITGEHIDSSMEITGVMA